jgi:hypothetical protein
LNYINDSYYEGFFKAGKYEGLGRMIKSDKCMYEGDWHLGLMHGTGIYWDNKFMFDGQVVNGKIM